MNLNEHLIDQVDLHWRRQLHPRLAGLTDDEYFWEPVPAWNVREVPGASSGAFTVDFAFPEPEPVPFTTIAWRLAHVIVGVLAMRSAAHFGRAPADYQSWEYAGTASAALAQLDEEYARWVEGVRSLGDEGLSRPCGPAEGPFADEPVEVLVLAINRELIHHLAEVCLLRDLYFHTHREDT
ncbi:MAG: DinB family protein [Actinomycetota bacterium]|nr:DinB family protein [Actinomycetota bacterium]